MNIEDCVTREDFRTVAMNLPDTLGVSEQSAVADHLEWITLQLQALTAAVLSLQAPTAHVAPETGTQQDDHWLQCTKCMPQHEHGCPMQPGSTAGRGAGARVVVLRDGHHDPLPEPDFIPEPLVTGHWNPEMAGSSFACPECGVSPIVGVSHPDALIDRHAPMCVSRPPLADPYA